MVKGKAVPMDRANVDTDQIIPAKHLKRIERTGYGEFAFEAWRNDPEFVLNRPEHADAKVMITRENFGSGSSREHAVWALDGLGIEALIGEGFADIFKNNCSQGGMLTVELPSEDIDHLMEVVSEEPGSEVEVDLEAQTVSLGDGSWQRHFDIDPFKKYRLLRGLDDIGMSLEYQADIARHESTRPGWLPATS